MKQGLYTTVIKYWDYLRKLHTSFFESSRDDDTIRGLLDDDEYAGANALQSTYLKSALKVLVEKLQGDVDDL